MVDPLQYLDAVGQLDPDIAYFAVDGDQNIIHWSEGAERLLGYQSEEVLGQHCSKAIHCIRCSTGCGVREHLTIRNKFITHYRKDGSKVALVKKARAVLDEQGQFVGGVEILVRDTIKSADEICDTPRKLSDFHGLLTADTGFLALLSSLRHAAHTDVNMLIRGESGSGKEMVARAIHRMSPRAANPFVAVNCGTLSREFLASELFGHRKGAFTGAIADKKGLLAEAEGGALFLDEVAELPMDVQAMLLRVIQEKRYRPLGHTRDFPADVRFISATHVSLREAVREKKFREDLMFRLRVVPVFLPALRERRVDIPLLMDSMLVNAAAKHRLEPVRLDSEVIACFASYPWPGNVRELVNVAEYLAVTRSGQLVTMGDLPPEFREAKAFPEPVRVKQGKPGPEEIKQALNETQGNTELAAEILGVSRATLWRWRKKFGIH